jgi:Raf kinase inhibitor-like YbhB/YbcL family protein
MDESRPPLTFAFFPEVPSFELTSRDVADAQTLSNDQVADIMGYAGMNKSPQLSWHGFPDETQGFAVTIHDPDAPTGSGFWHWIVLDLAKGVTELPTGAGSSGGGLPEGAMQLRNDAGTIGYVGAAPPPGDAPHRYVVVVHALDIANLEVPHDAAPAIAGFNLRFHTIARAQLVPIFGS